MKKVDWSKEKSRWLKEIRGVSFEEIKIAIDSSKLIEEIDHPNQKKYPNQKMYVVNFENYIYLVPFVEDREKIFFKTIIPSKKATKKYLQKGV